MPQSCAACLPKIRQYATAADFHLLSCMQIQTKKEHAWAVSTGFSKWAAKAKTKMVNSNEPRTNKSMALASGIQRNARRRRRRRRRRASHLSALDVMNKGQNGSLFGA